MSCCKERTRALCTAGCRCHARRHAGLSRVPQLRLLARQPQRAAKPPQAACTRGQHPHCRTGSSGAAGAQPPHLSRPAPAQCTAACSLRLGCRRCTAAAAAPAPAPAPAAAAAHASEHALPDACRNQPAGGGQLRPLPRTGIPATPHRHQGPRLAEEVGVVVAVVVQVGDQLLARLLDQLACQGKVPDGRVRCLAQVQRGLVPARQAHLMAHSPQLVAGRSVSQAASAALTSLVGKPRQAAHACRWSATRRLEPRQQGGGTTPQVGQAAVRLVQLTLEVLLAQDKQAHGV